MFRLLTEPSSGGFYVTKTAYIYKRLFIGSLCRHNFYHLHINNSEGDKIVPTK
jgi:hypothetical protein